MDAPDRPGERVRVYGSLRTAHLERFEQMVPARMLYTHARYDFDPTAVDLAEEPVRLTDWGVVRELFRRHHAVVELNEPAMVDRWKYLLAQLAAIRLRSLLARRPTVVAAYCIGNADPETEVQERWGIAPPTGRPLVKLMMRVLVAMMDRLAFGTEGSVEMYRRHVGERQLRGKSALFEALPSPCGCLVGSTGDRRANRLVFVGSFAERKGVPGLMRAWDVLRERDSAATLLILGKGRLEEDIVAWATDRPEVTVEIDPPRPRIHQTLRESGALILLSQRNGFWREQVGLPIVEGLGHGCEIITTDETGLAPWLGEHGHSVVTPDASAEEVADRIEDAFRHARGRTGSLDDLPRADSRILADRWMMTGATSHADGVGTT